MSKVQSITVSADDDGQRLDRWLKKTVDNLPFGLSQKLIRKGQIRVDGKRVKPDTRLSEGQEVRIPPLDDSSSKHKDNKKKPPKISKQDEDFIRSLVIYQDEAVIVLNKPPGLAVQGGSKTRRHVDGMLEAFTGRDGVKPRLVHRLDKDTSGVMLVARTAKAAKALGASFKGRDAKKIYWALVTPVPENPDGKIKAPLIKAGGPQKEKMVVDDQEGKFALTEYRVLEQAGHLAAFVAFWPRTGRTHQIRVHAQLMGCPVVGDGKYGGAASQIEGVEHPRQLHLHARRVIIPHPARKGWLDVSAPLPPEMAKTWKALGFGTKSKEDPFADLEI